MFLHEIARGQKGDPLPDVAALAAACGTKAATGVARQHKAGPGRIDSCGRSVSVTEDLVAGCRAGRALLAPQCQLDCLVSVAAHCLRSTRQSQVRILPVDEGRGLHAFWSQESSRA